MNLGIIEVKWLLRSNRKTSLIKKVKCLIGIHQWNNYQHSVIASEFSDKRIEFVIAFKVCEHCAHSKLIHLLE